MSMTDHPTMADRTWWPTAAGLAALAAAPEQCGSRFGRFTCELPYGHGGRHEDHSYVDAEAAVWAWNVDERETLQAGALVGLLATCFQCDRLARPGFLTCAEHAPTTEVGLDDWTAAYLAQREHEAVADGFEREGGQ